MAKRVVLPNPDSGFTGLGRSLLTLDDWLGLVAVFVAALLLAGSAFGQDRRIEADRPQTLHISGAVHDGNGQGVARTEVLIEGVRPEVTDDFGVFKFPLQPPLKVGFPVTFSVPGWVVVDPCILARGRLYLPDPTAETILLRVLRPGDRKLLSGDSIGCIVERETSQFRAGQAKTQSEVDLYLASHAKELGFTVEQLTAAIDRWASSTKDLYQRGLAALYEGRYPQAARFISKSIPSPPGKFLERYVPLARAEYEQGHDIAAGTALRKVLAMHGDDSLVLNSLGVVLGAQAKYPEAEQLSKRALAIREKALGPHHSRVAEILNNLATLYGEQEKYGEAEPLYKRALAIDEKAVGPDDPEVATDLSLLALLYQEQGKYGEAEPLFKRALAIREKALGPDHPMVAVLAENLASTLRKVGRDSEARVYEEQVARIRAKIKPHSTRGGQNPAAPSVGNMVTPRTDRELKSALQFVVVDQSEPAFIVFTGIPNDIDKEKLEKIKLKVSSRETLTMLTWEQFLESVNRYARSVMLRDDYPNFKVVDGIVCLVASKKGSGSPWGLTWNGGIALTFNDYQHARRTYKSYKANPSAYRPIKDPRRDPVNPGGFLPFFGCSQAPSAQARESSDCKLSDLNIDADIPKGYVRVSSECPTVVYVKKLSPTHALGFNISEPLLPYSSSENESPSEAVSDYVVSVERFIAKTYKGQSYNTQRIDENADYPPSLIDYGGAFAGLDGGQQSYTSGHREVKT